MRKIKNQLCKLNSMFKSGTSCQRTTFPTFGSILIDQMTNKNWNYQVLINKIGLPTMRNLECNLTF